MTSFASIKGHPVVTVTADSTASRITLRQRKYRTRVVEAAAADASPLWTIPLDVQLFTAKDGGGVTTTTKKVVLDKAEMTIELGQAAGVIAVDESYWFTISKSAGRPSIRSITLSELMSDT